MYDSNESVDIIVIGCGAAGLSSALSAVETASEDGSPRPNIVVLERATREERGGNTRWTGAYMRLVDETRVADRFVEDMMEFSDGLSDERYVRRLAREAPDTVGWIHDKGVEFDHLPIYFLTASRPRFAPVGGGAAIVDALADHLGELDVPIFYETTAERILIGEDGEITGLEVLGPGGETLQLGTKAVIIASGGFEGNRDMLSQYVGPNAKDLPTVAPGGEYNRGEGIRMALDLGAKSAGQWDLFHAEPVDPRSSKSEAIVMTFPYGILVNKMGERFLDEGEDTVDEIYERVTHAIFKQPDQIAFLIADKKILEIPDYRRAVYTDQDPIQADTISDLADRIGIDQGALNETVTRYNAALAEDQSQFDAFEPDGLSTHSDLSPPKSNWARSIDTPPYVAYPIVASIVFTFGGIATNDEAEVVTVQDEPIPGLYAAGEVTGLYYHKYPGATSVLRCLVFGRIAGRRATRYVQARTSA